MKSILFNTMDIDGLNFLIKKYRLAEWVKKHDSSFGSLSEIHLWLKRQKKIFQEHRSRNDADIIILLSDKMGFNTS